MKTESTFDEFSNPSNYFNLQELFSIEQKLEEVYERKASILRDIFNGESAVANPEQHDELDNITVLEASLISKAEELRMSIEVENVSNGLTENSTPNIETDFDDIRNDKEQSHDDFDLER